MDWRATSARRDYNYALSAMTILTPASRSIESDAGTVSRQDFSAMGSGGDGDDELKAMVKQLIATIGAEQQIVRDTKGRVTGIKRVVKGNGA